MAPNNTVYTYDGQKWIGTSNPAVTTVAPVGTAGTVTTNAQPNITSTGTLVSLAVTGGVTAASFTGSHSGAGNNLSNIQGANVSGAVSFATTANAVAGANVSGQVGNALVAGTVYTAAQPNITSVGTLTGLSSGGVVNLTTASNVSLGPVGNVKITGGTTGQVLSTNGSGTLSWVSAPTPASGIVTGTAAQDYQKSATAPTTRSTAGGSAALVEGDMWYDTTNDTLYVRSGASTWLSAGGGGGGPTTGIITGTAAQDYQKAASAPTTRSTAGGSAALVEGDMWYDTANDVLMVRSGASTWLAAASGASITGGTVGTYVIAKGAIAASITSTTGGSFLRWEDGGTGTDVNPGLSGTWQFRGWLTNVGSFLLWQRIA